MTANLSFIELVIEASFVVQLVLVLLLLASIASWAIIFRKRRLLQAAMSDSDAFESSFWSGGDLTAMYREI
ncbi:MAG: protein TolQ, partial [Gammaproteobacteria bacterium]|nr:protein TolQ [Gammaproteobacteria bacterium]